MVHAPELSEFKQAIASLYDRRSQSYDEGHWCRQICERLLEYTQISAGQAVLDIGTGTGTVAIAAAQAVGSQGRVVGVDLSTGMLSQAQRKVKTLGLNHIELQLADAEVLDFPSSSFDHILCANTFPWMADKAATLRLWHRFLKPGGKISVHTPADTAYVGPVILGKVLAKHGLVLEASNRIGSIQQCRDLFANAGFEDIDIHIEPHGSYTTFEAAKLTWESVVVQPSLTAPKVIDNELSQLSETQLSQIKAEFEAALDSLRTEQGIWDDRTTLYILGRKPESGT